MYLAMARKRQTKTARINVTVAAGIANVAALVVFCDPLGNMANSHANKPVTLSWLHDGQ